MEPVPYAAELAARSLLHEFPPELTDVNGIPDEGGGPDNWRRHQPSGYDRGVRSVKTPARVHLCTVRKLRSSCRAISD
jgi:hypothetical protein